MRHKDNSKEKDIIITGVCDCVRACVCVCVWEREREREFFRRLCGEECVGEVKTALSLIAVGLVGAVEH